MRSPEQPRAKPYRPRTTLKKHGSRRTWSFKSNYFSSCVSLGNIDEVLRETRSKHGEGRGSWKVVPKDSCELYKNRRKRQQEEESKSNDGSYNSETSIEKKEKKRPRKKQLRKRVKTSKRSKTDTKNSKRSREPSTSSCKAASETSSQASVEYLD
ncbi:uncharacterized protein LOC142985226 [Anticarsia gemmatalis]|uniref:uncharacterized protein LOC142985226 n=1 Tax=Anticarsia gemmatalis TaxID=129554 RepID=UPI003F757EBB